HRAARTVAAPPVIIAGGVLLSAARGPNLDAARWRCDHDVQLSGMSFYDAEWIHGGVPAGLIASQCGEDPMPALTEPRPSRRSVLGWSTAAVAGLAGCGTAGGSSDEPVPLADRVDLPTHVPFRTVPPDLEGRHG